MSWADRALCATEYGPAFDRELGAVQIAVCVQCGVREQCLEDALEVERRMPYRPDGVRGGMTGRMRSKIIRAERAGERKGVAS